MNSKKIIAMLFFAGLFTLLACEKEDDKPLRTTVISTNNNQPTNLTTSEIRDLQFLREEEKLAHDVYLFAYQKHGINLFNNIANSELKHTSSVLDVFNKYGIADLAHSLGAGTFTDSTLQNLYKSLTMKVDSSLTDALIVGATIEDLDLQDLREMKNRTNKTDLETLYDNLSCGSRNHMRSFYSQLNGNYQAQYISSSELQSIVTSAKEKCSP